MKIRLTQKALRKSLAVSLALGVLAVATNVKADAECGEGKIIEILEGGENSNDLMIKIENQHIYGTARFFNGYIRFAQTAGKEERLRGIRAIAYLAMAGEKTVVAYSHTNSCKNADQLSIVK